MTDRYEGRSFLRLLECYVLHAIDALAPDARSGLREIEPKLRQVYGHPGSWDEVVAAQMGFSDAAAEELRRMWARQHADGQPDAPEAFARAVADEMIR